MAIWAIGSGGRIGFSWVVGGRLKTGGYRLVVSKGGGGFYEVVSRVGSLQIKIDIGETSFECPLSAMRSIGSSVPAHCGWEVVRASLFSFTIRLLSFGLVCCLGLISPTFSS